jgi:hypothetical protein
MQLVKTPRRRFLAAWLVLVTLFAQLATAAYACPHGLADGAKPMPACHGAQSAPDVDLPQLCKSHCEQGAQSLSPSVALDLSAAPVLLAVLDWTPQAPVALQAWPVSLRAGAPPPGSPPIYIALQVLRN